ncbi:MAG: hypothetical protein JW800_01155 [Candidatus Omnitrophica bacterium]|nr:hypothetical protein [Candidatus Omnitrophota bacterium]
MKRQILVLTALCFFTFIAVSSSLAEVKSAKDLAKAKKAELNNTRWSILVMPSDSRGRAEADVLSFIDGKFGSSNLENAGFARTDFTVRIDEQDETVIWETMQTDKDGNHAFWRGDVKEGSMRGVLTKIDTRGRNYNFTFASQK